MGSRSILVQFKSKPHTLVLKLMANGVWEEKHTMLDNETHNEALGIRQQFLRVLATTPSEERIDKLFRLAPKSERTNSYRKLCGKLVEQYS